MLEPLHMGTQKQGLELLILEMLVILWWEVAWFFKLYFSL